MSKRVLHGVQAAGENSSGFTNERSPQGEVLAGICWTKSQSPRYSLGLWEGGWGGGGGVVTND